MRIGMGYDVHAFQEGRKLILGGVEIEYKLGLAGHSDADVLIHAVMDAILGACGLGDIGVHFPDYDMQYKNISSMLLLARVKEKMAKSGHGIVNIDSVIIAQEPKISKYFDSMCKNIASVLGIDRKQVNVKATTTEGLGFCGRKEGIAAQCIALLE